MPARPRAAAAVHLARPLLLVAPLVAVIVLVGCSQPGAPRGRSGDILTPGKAMTVDLDGDGAGEQVLIEEPPYRLAITDGAVFYQSREKWQIAEAALGDTDGNGLPEVVALLDADDGRHLGLFAFMGGQYRERLVTGVLNPRPISLRVVPGSGAADGAGDQGGKEQTTAGQWSLGQSTAGQTNSDLLVLIETTGSDSGSRATTYRWNGFGFTALGTEDILS